MSNENLFAWGDFVIMFIYLILYLGGDRQWLLV